MASYRNSICRAAAAGAVLLAIGIAGSARAVDGVIEINQASVKAAGGFPFMVGKSGSYRLTGNLDVTDATARPGGMAAENTTAIIIATDNVTVDLNGFSITGPTACSGCPVTSCAPTGTGRGIKVDAPSGHVAQVTIVNGTVHGMGDDGIFLQSGADVQRVHAMNNGASGIDVGDSNVVIANIASSNGAFGIDAGFGGTVSSNTAECNHTSGIAAASSTVSGNSTNTNGNAGIRVDDASAVIANTASSNSSFGLSFSGSTGGYSNNVLDGNNGGDANPQVSGGNQMGTNICRGSTTCP